MVVFDAFKVARWFAKGIFKIIFNPIALCLFLITTIITSAVTIYTYLNEKFQTFERMFDLTELLNSSWLDSVYRHESIGNYVLHVLAIDRLIDVVVRYSDFLIGYISILAGILIALFLGALTWYIRSVYKKEAESLFK